MNDKPSWMTVFRKRLLNYRYDVLSGIHYTYHDDLNFDVLLSPEDYREFKHSVANIELHDAMNDRFMMFGVKPWGNLTSSIGFNSTSGKVPPEFEPLDLDKYTPTRDNETEGR